MRACSKDTCLEYSVCKMVLKVCETRWNCFKIRSCLYMIKFCWDYSKNDFANKGKCESDLMESENDENNNLV